MTNQGTSQTKLLIAHNLDRGIVSKGMTNRALGERVGKTEHQVWRWRHGRHTPELDTLAALADVLFAGDIAEFMRPLEDQIAA